MRRKHPPPCPDQRFAHEQQEGERHPCRYCNSPTLQATLSQYGARCLRCYEDFCVQGDRSRGFMAGDRDTPQQAEMRKRLKANRPTGVKS